MSDRAPRRLIDDPAVGPLLRSFDATPPPAAQARVWRGLEKQAFSKPTPWMRWAVPASALAGVLIAYLIVRPSPGDSVQLAAIEGTVSSAEPGQVLLPARAGQSLKNGSRVRTAENGRATLLMFGGARIDVAPSSLLAIDGAQVALIEGRLLAAMPARSSLAFVAGRWRVIGGGRFDLARVGEADVAIVVQDGVVELENEGRVERVGAGERFESASAGAEASASASAKASASASAKASAIAEADAEEPAVQPKKPRSRSPSRSRTSVTKSEDRSRKSVDREPPTEPETARREPPAETVDPAPSPLIEQPAAPKPDQTPAIPELPRVPPPPTEAELYKQASETRDPQLALRLFDRIEHNKGAYSELAGHQAARLEMRLGRYRDAAARLERLLAQKPKGSFSQEARLSLIECALRTGERKKAAKELETFLALHPESERQPELRFLRAELSRSAGRCNTAVGDYRAAVGSRHDDDARYFLAYCLIESGAKDEGLEALRDYLQKKPSGKHAAEARAGIERSR